MRFFKKLRRRWQLDRDLEDELRFHLESKAADTGDASTARRLVGNPTALAETCRDMWTFAFLESAWQDLRYALRTLGKSPGFVFVAVAALAFGIGADTAVFTIGSAAFSWDLGIDHPERVVFLEIDDPSQAGGFESSFLNYAALKSEIHSLSSLMAYRWMPANVSGKGVLPERYHCVQMTANAFSMFGRNPLMGRYFTMEDQHPGAAPVVVLSYHLWQERFGKDPSIVGRTLRVDAEPRVVIGVMPAGMQFPENAELWTPLVSERDWLSGGRGAPLFFGRLADGVKLAAARSELSTIARRFARQRPESYRGLLIDVQPIFELMGFYHARALGAAVFCAVGFVLLIACADVANLLLARAASRSREISIRMAIGAGRWRIVRQLLIESLVLAAGGGFFGWLIAFTGLRWFDSSTSQAPRPLWLDFSMNTRVFLYLAAISIGTGILFGLAPALRLARLDVHNAIKDGGHAAAGGTRGRSLANLLVIAEIVLCVILLAGAGLTIRSAMNLYGAPVGVNTAGVLTMRINLPQAKYARPEDELAFHARLKTRLESLPGVEVASMASDLPMRSSRLVSYDVEGSAPDAGHSPRVGSLLIGTDYFRVMQVKPLSGRASVNAGEVIVNQSFAQKVWPGENALGKRLRLVKNKTPQPWLTIAGVAPDILQNFRHPVQRDPMIYLPYAGESPGGVFVIARTRVPAATLAEAFRQEPPALDPDVAAFEIQTLESRIAQQRLNVGAFSAVFTTFAMVALLLAAVGLYAVMAHSVSRRTQEIGIRMAIGGARHDILALLFGEAMRPLAIGLTVGLPLAFGVTRVLQASLVGVAPGDPITFAGVVVVMVLAGVLGCAIPARRATRVDPLVALRCE